MTDSRFKRRVKDPNGEVSFTLDGSPALGCKGDTVAAALLAIDGSAFRQTGISGVPRTAFCMMGVCFECLVTIDGVPNRQACMITLADGMDVCRQRGFRPLEGQP